MTSQSSIESHLRDRLFAWMMAVQKKDLADLQQILAAEFIYTASGQGRWSRQQWLDTVAIYDIERFTFTEIEVQPYGDVAVTLSRYEQDAIVNGAPRSGQFLITDVWILRDGAWQVVARSSILNAIPPATS